MLIGAAALFVPISSFALGLGGIQVHSALNEPLNAEIELISASPKELKALNATLATRAEFDRAGVDRLPYLSQIKFTIARKLDGRHVLQLNTEQQIDEPFLHLVVQVEWTGGRLVREYAALIDPPQQVRAKPAGIEPPVATAGAEPALGAATGTIAPITEPSVAPIAEPAAPAAPADVAAPATDVAPQTTAESATPAANTQTKIDDIAPAATPLAEETPPAATAPPVEPLPATDTAVAPLADAAAAPVAQAPADAPLLGPSVDSAPSTVESPAPTVAPLAEDTSAPTATGGVTAGATAADDARVTSVPSPSWAKVGEYSVKRGDTLWGIVEQVRDDRQLTMEQAVLAVYKANRDAFFGNNVNNLRAGKILKIPERDRVESESAQAARKEFRAQYDVWQEYKLRLASTGSTLKVPDSATPVEASPEPKTGAKSEPAPVAAKQKETPSSATKKADGAAPAKSPDDMLKIVRSSIQDDKQKGTPEKKVAETEATKDAKERQALADRATTLEESLVSRQIEAKDLADKIGQVRSQLKKESRLIELESQALAQATKKSATVETKTPPAPEKSAAADTPKETPKAETPKVEAPKPVETASKAEPAKPTGSVVEKKAEPKKEAPAVEEKGFIESALESVLAGDTLIYLGGGLGIVGLIVGAVYMRRRKKSIAEFEESILSADSIAGETSAANTSTDTAGAVVSAGDTSFLSDFSQGGMGNIHTDEVDPVAEADVYLAYGRDETAEEILKDAVVKNPDRNELKIKLLEIYAQRNDVQAFETLAEELYAALGGRRDKNWEKVEEMGRKLNPSNPMFSGGAPAGKAAGGNKSFADTHRGTQAVPAMAAAPAVSSGDSADAISLDFSGIGDSAPEPKSEAPAALDFDLGSGLDMGKADTKPSGGGIDFNATLQASAADLNAPAGGGLDSLDFSVGDASSGSDTGGINFDSDLSMGASEPASAPASGGGGLDFDLDMATGDSGTEAAVAEAPPAGVSAGGGSSGQWDETATKLDLAKAYIDMGDAEGAKSILDEVMAEGSDEQKRQAQQLASQLG